MSWTFIILLAGGAFAFKVLGLIAFGGRHLPPPLERCLDLIPAALLSALIVKDTFSIGEHLALDARAAGISAAVLAAWRRAPLALVVALGAGVTALVRAAA